MRQPSIHITESDLKDILTELMPTTTPGRIDWLSEKILKKAKNKSLTNRTIVTLKNENNKKRVEKVTSATDHDTMMMGKAINNNRIKLKHKGVRPFRESSREWTVLKELTSLVLQFSNDFDLEKDEGMNIFSKISLRHLSKSSKSNIIGKMINSFDLVVNLYEGIQEMENDKDPVLTEKLFNKYRISILKYSGLRTVELDKDELLPYFYRMKQIAERLGVTPFTYMDAQFDQLQWTGTYPSPEQLINEKSKERLYKYRYESDHEPEMSKGPDQEMVRQLKSIRK